MKMIWKANPGVFFILFWALHNAGAFSIEQHGLDQMKVAEMLYKAFEVSTLRKGKKPYTLSTFKQNFKRTSAFQGSQDFVEVNKVVDQLVKALENLKMI